MKRKSKSVQKEACIITDEAQQLQSDARPSDFGSKSMNEYLLGSRKLKPFPVSMSLIASYISGVTILGTPAEIYNFGTQYWLVVVSIYLMGVTVSYVYLPVFTKLRVGSSYEYLELRFSSTVRTIASTMFVIDEVGILLLLDLKKCLLMIFFINLGSLSANYNLCASAGIQSRYIFYINSFYHCITNQPIVHVRMSHTFFFLNISEIVRPYGFTC